jgi:hypothetical protein
VVPQNTLLWVLGLDFNEFADTRINMQIFQSHFFNHDPDIIPVDQRIRLQPACQPQVQRQVRGTGAVDRQPESYRLDAAPACELEFREELAPGAGCRYLQRVAPGYFGRYDAKDRVYTELLRYSF